MLRIGHQHWLHTNLEAGLVKNNITDPFAIKFDIKTPVLNLDFNLAADYTAKLIADKYTNLHLCLSGGLDSEYVAAVLCRNKIPFTPVIILTPDNSEVWYAFKFCDEHKLTPVVFDFSSRSASTNYVYELLIKLYQIATTVKLPVGSALITNVVPKLLSDSSATVITGYGDPLHISDRFSEPMGDVFEITDHDCYLNLEYGDRHPGAFFTFTPEIFKAMITDIDCTVNSQLAKSKLYSLLERTKSNSILPYIRDGLTHGNPILSEINKKFVRRENLKFITFSRQQLLDML